MEAAKREGSVVWYTSTPLRQAHVVADAFEKKHGFKVEIFRTALHIMHSFWSQPDPVYRG